MGEITKEKYLRRVPKGQAKRESRGNQDPFDYCLECWKDWMFGDADRDLNAKAMGGLIGNIDGYSCDPYEQQQASETRIAAASDAMIDGLKIIHRWAIYESTGVGTPWKFPRADLIATYADARIELESMLKKNVCTGVLF